MGMTVKYIELVDHSLRTIGQSSVTGILYPSALKSLHEPQIKCVPGLSVTLLK